MEVSNFKFQSNFILLDLEYTAWKGSNERKWQGPNEHREIIEIGAIYVDEEQNYKEISNFNKIIMPKINPVLSTYIVKLTGINNVYIKNNGITFNEGINSFVKFCKNKSNNIYFYGDDNKVISENIKINNLDINLDILSFYNIKPHIENILSIKKNSVESSDLNKIIGIRSNKKKHRALNDCRTILKVIKYINSGKHFASENYE